jgi:hypothetical protein
VNQPVSLFAFQSILLIVSFRLLNSRSTFTIDSQFAGSPAMKFEPDTETQRANSDLTAPPGVLVTSFCCGPIGLKAGKSQSANFPVRQRVCIGTDFANVLCCPQLSPSILMKPQNRSVIMT